MNRPVNNKCLGCTKYNQGYVDRRSNEEHTNPTLHVCGRTSCTLSSGSTEFEPNTKAVLEGSAKTSSHYQVGTKQPIEIMQEVMTPEEFQGFLRGNVIKYSLRLGHKDAAVKEAAKIEQYAKWLRTALEGNTIKHMED